MTNSKNILFDNYKNNILDFDPICHKKFLSLEQPSLVNNQADIDKVRQYLELTYDSIQIPLSIMKDLPQKIRENNWEINVIVGRFQAGWKLIDVQPGYGNNQLYGLCIDIGTTTVVVYLINMESGQIDDVEAGYNRQVEFGEDILTRIFWSSDKGGRVKLKNAALKSINYIIEDICVRNNLQKNEIYAAVIAGNNTMIHLLLELEANNICISPYVPAVNSTGFLKGEEVGLFINKEATIYCLPAVGSYVGGDAVGGVLVNEMYLKEEISLFVDIGTNGEIIMGNKDWLVACAGAAGPALEGGVARLGMRAEPGAIEEVQIDMDGKVVYRVIGKQKPRGICGSGLIDCLAQLFLTGHVDRAGNLVKGDKFVIATEDESSTGEEIAITQQDIDSLMRTKGAVSAALDYLVESVGCSLSDIEYFYAAGAFGQYLNLESAVTIGLYPDLPREKMIRLGNSAGEGARQVLLSSKKQKDLEKIIKNVTYFELNASEVFMNKFVSSRFLPHTNLDLFPSVKERLFLNGLLNGTE